MVQPRLPHGASQVALDSPHCGKVRSLAAFVAGMTRIRRAMKHTCLKKAHWPSDRVRRKVKASCRVILLGWASLAKFVPKICSCVKSSLSLKSFP